MKSLSFIKFLVLMLCISILFTCVSCTTNGTSKATTNTTAGTTSALTTKETDLQDGGEVYLIRSSAMNTGGYQTVIDQIHKETEVEIKTVWTDPASTVDQFVLLMSSGEKIDLSFASVAKFSEYLKAGVLAPLNSAIDKYGINLKARVRPDLWDWCKDSKGDIYAIPNEQVACVTSLDVRQDWLDALKIKAPSTVDEYEGMLKTFKNTYNCAPLLVRLDNSGRHWEAFLSGAFLPMGYSWWQNTDGKYYPPEMHPEYIEMLKLMTKWWAEGLISQDSLSLRANGKALVEANKVGAFMDSWGLGGLYSRDAIKVINGLNFVSLPALSGNYSNGNYSVMSPSSYSVVSVKSQNIAGIIKVYDWIASDLEHTIISRIGIKDINWKYENENGAAPTSFSKAENKVIMLTAEKGREYTGGSMELLDINDFVERRVTTDPYMIAANNWWELNYGNKLKKYETLDDQLRIVSTTLSCLTQISDCQKALQEKTIAIITGAEPIDNFSSWINSEYQKIGMSKIIEEKTAAYNNAKKNQK